MRNALSCRGVSKPHRFSKTRPLAGLVPEMAHPVKTIASPASSAAAITSSSRIEPPGWITAVAPPRPPPSARRGRERRRPRPRRCPGQRRGQAQRLGHALGLRAAMRQLSTRLIWPAPTPTVAPSLDIDDGVGLHVLGDGPGEQHVGHLGVGRGALRHDLQIVRRYTVPRVASCTSKPPETCRRPAPRAGSASRRWSAGAGSSWRRKISRRHRRLRRDHHLGEDLGDLLGGLAVQRPFSATMPPKADVRSQSKALL